MNKSERGPPRLQAAHRRISATLLRAGLTLNNGGWISLRNEWRRSYGGNIVEITSWELLAPYCSRQFPTFSRNMVAQSVKQFVP